MPESPEESGCEACGAPAWAPSDECVVCGVHCEACDCAEALLWERGVCPKVLGQRRRQALDEMAQHAARRQLAEGQREDARRKRRREYERAKAASLRQAQRQAEAAKSPQMSLLGVR